MASLCFTVIYLTQVYGVWENGTHSSPLQTKESFFALESAVGTPSGIHSLHCT